MFSLILRIRRHYTRISGMVVQSSRTVAVVFIVSNCCWRTNDERHQSPMFTDSPCILFRIQAFDFSSKQGSVVSDTYVAHDQRERIRLHWRAHSTKCTEDFQLYDTTMEKSSFSVEQSPSSKKKDRKSVKWTGSLLR
jgi:hypothetical protein